MQVKSFKEWDKTNENLSTSEIESHTDKLEKIMNDNNIEYYEILEVNGRNLGDIYRHKLNNNLFAKVDGIDADNIKKLNKELVSSDYKIVMEDGVYVGLKHDMNEDDTGRFESEPLKGTKDPMIPRKAKQIIDTYCDTKGYKLYVLDNTKTNKIKLSFVDIKNTQSFIKEVEQKEVDTKDYKFAIESVYNGIIILKYTFKMNESNDNVNIGYVSIPVNDIEKMVLSKVGADIKEINYGTFNKYDIKLNEPNLSKGIFKIDFSITYEAITTPESPYKKIKYRGTISINIDTQACKLETLVKM